MMVHRVLIKIDTAEGALKQLLSTFPGTNNIVYENLPVGDILFIVDRVPTLLIERKEAGDFRGSVADGRFREQRSRMVQLRKKHPEITLAFLFEGSFASLNYNAISRIQQRTLEDLANDLGPKYGICRLESNNLMDTIRLIGRYENVFKEKGPTADIVESNNITESMSIGKKRGIDRMSFAPCALSLVPGLTREAALSVTAVYPTLLNLINAFDDIADTKTKEELLVGFEYSNGLSIGPTVSKRVCHFLLDIDPPPKHKRKAPSPRESNTKKQKKNPSPTSSESSSSWYSAPKPVRNRDKSPKRPFKKRVTFAQAPLTKPAIGVPKKQTRPRRKRPVID